MSTPVTFPLSTATFRSDTYNYDPLLASEISPISQSAKIAGSLGVLKRGTVLYGPAVGTPITLSTLLTTATGAGAPRAILAQDIDTTGGAVIGLVYTQGKFLDTAMIFTTAGAASDAALLWDVGIYVLTVEGRSGQLIPMTGLPSTGGPIPNVATPAQADQILKDEVDAIRAATPPEPGRPLPPIPPGTPAVAQDPAWAIAAFGETPKPSWLEKGEQVRTEAIDLQTKQDEELRKLEEKHAKELSEFHRRAQEERQKFVKDHPPEPPPAPPVQRVQPVGPFPTGHVMTPPSHPQEHTAPKQEHTAPKQEPHVTPKDKK